MKKLVAAVVGLGLVGLGAVTLFGDNFRQLFGASGAALAGDPTAQYRSAKGSMGLSSVGSSGGGGGLTHFGSSGSTGNSHASTAPRPTARAVEDRFSTFALDVDTASYTFFRAAVTRGQRPDPASVRVEEWVNYFQYGYAAPSDRVLGVEIAGARSPLGEERHLVSVAITGRIPEARMPVHLVFLADVSGSMSDRLELARASMKIVLGTLRDGDTVGLVTYAGEVREVLSQTSIEDREEIEEAIDSLHTGGGTAMGDGLELAYRQAASQAREGHVARVMVFTDGDTNLGRNLTAQQMLAAVKGYVDDGVTLSTIGFGMGNYRDDLMEKLANSGNGNCIYIDSADEARLALGERARSLLEVAARDAKVQVEFDPEAVKSYRLLGYDNRELADRDFRNDEVDAGEVGVGHQVTAIYELELGGSQRERLGVVRTRAVADGGAVEEGEAPILRSAIGAQLEEADADLRFAVAVALAADVLRGAPEAKDVSLARVTELAAGATDGRPERSELVTLLRRAYQAPTQTVAHYDTY